jgi:hypothetical protein
MGGNGAEWTEAGRAARRQLPPERLTGAGWAFPDRLDLKSAPGSVDAASGVAKLAHPGHGLAQLDTADAEDLAQVLARSLGTGHRALPP